MVPRTGPHVLRPDGAYPSPVAWAAPACSWRAGGGGLRESHQLPCPSSSRTPPKGHRGSAPPRDIQVECGDIVDAATAHRAGGKPPPGASAGACRTRRWSRRHVGHRSDELTDQLLGAEGTRRVEHSLATAAQPPSGSACSPRSSPWWARRSQGAYAQVNSRLDALLPTGGGRRGLPATSIAWGACTRLAATTALAEGTGAAIAPSFEVPRSLPDALSATVTGVLPYPDHVKFHGARSLRNVAPIAGSVPLTAKNPATGTFAEVAVPRGGPRTVRRLVSGPDQPAAGEPLIRPPLSDYGLIPWAT